MKRLLILLACVLAQVPLSAQAATLLASDQNGNLISVDTTTGAGTPIGQEVGFPLATEIEFDPISGLLYSEESNGALNLHTVDPQTGLSTGFVTHGCCAMNGLEFVGSTLYATNIQGGGGAAPSTLETIDTATGINTAIGPTGFGPISGLAWDNVAGIMYGVTAGPQPAILVSVNLATGLATPLVPLADPTGAPLLRVGSIEFASDGMLYGGVAQNSPLNPGWLFSIDVNTGVSTFIGPTGLVGITGLTDAVSVADDSGTVRFQVVKTFSDGSTDNVDVMLTCNAGLPLEQSYTIAGGDPNGVTFVVTNLPQSGATCEVTETGGPDNYDVVMNGGAGCTWTGVTGGFASCIIENRAGPAEYTVTVDWMLTEGWVIEDSYEVTVDVTCASDILSIDGAPYAGGTMAMVTLDDGESAVFEVNTASGDSQCSAVQTISQSGVEPEASDECTNAVLPAGSSAECTFTNTVFFEGIPTLNQLGMAMMILLMMGAGFVFMRRIA